MSKMSVFNPELDLSASRGKLNAYASLLLLCHVPSYIMLMTLLIRKRHHSHHDHNGRSISPPCVRHKPDLLRRIGFDWCKLISDELSQPSGNCKYLLYRARMKIHGADLFDTAGRPAYR